MSNEAERTDPVRRLKEQRTALHALAKLQTELRTAAQTVLTTGKVTVSALATRWGLHDKRLSDFLEGKLVVAGGEILTRLATGAQRPELIELILAEQQVIKSDRLLGLAKLSGELIDLSIDLQIACLEAGFQVASPEQISDYAGLFGINADPVRHAILGNAETLASMNAQTRDTILAVVVDNNYQAWVDELIRTVAARKQALADEFAGLVNRLVPEHYETRSSLAVPEVLGCYRNTLANALAGKSGDKTVRGLIERAKALLEQATKPSVPKPPAPTPTKPTPSAVAATPQPVPTTPTATQARSRPSPAALTMKDDGFEALCGRTSPQGIPHTVTREAILAVKAKLQHPESFATEVIRAQRVARAMMIAAMNVELTQKERERINREIEELHLAWTAWSHDNPNGVTQLIEDQRATWAMRRTTTTSVKNGKGGT